MGKGTIASGGTDGLYQVTLDYGQATRDARVANITAELAALVGKIADAQALLDGQQAMEDAQKAVVQGAIAAYVAASRAVGPALAAVNAALAALADVQADALATPEELAAAQATLSAANNAYADAKAAIEPALKNYTEAAAALATLKGKTAALRLPLELLKAQQTQQTKDLATWTALVLTETVPAWCADLTEDASGEVATLEIPGENALVLVAPAAPAPGPTDGVLTAREVQSPEQVFWNAAVLPGWQKWKPTYRRGTITALDVELDTASVTLFDDVSSAQNLGINQQGTLTNVPVQYMTCHADAFEVGDVCVVKFTGQDQSQPKVVGFVDHPKACGPEFVLVPIVAATSELVDSGSPHDMFAQGYTFSGSECVPDDMLFWNSGAGIVSVPDAYYTKSIGAIDEVYFPEDSHGWIAPALAPVTLWSEKHGVWQESYVTNPYEFASTTHNNSYVTGVGFGGLYVRTRNWPFAEANLPSGIASECALVGFQTAIMHASIASYPSNSTVGQVSDFSYLVNTSDFAEMAAFLDVAGKMPPTLTLTKGARTAAYTLDGVTGAGMYGSRLYVKYKRPGAG